MKSRKFLLIGVVSLLLALIVAALTLPTIVLAAGSEHRAVMPTFVDLPVVPEWAKLLILAGFTWLFTNGAKAIAKTFPWIPNIEKEGAVLCATLVGLVVTIANAALALIPPEYYSIVNSFFVFLGVVLGASGIHWGFMKFVPVQYELQSIKVENLNFDDKNSPPTMPV